jgi:hypothetical protein
MRSFVVCYRTQENGVEVEVGLKAGIKGGITAIVARPLACVAGALVVIFSTVISGTLVASASSVIATNVQIPAGGAVSKIKIPRSALPSNSSDNIATTLPAGTSLARAQAWLAGLISYRQTALFAAQNAISSSRSVSPANRAQLVALEQATASRLNTIAIRSLSVVSVAQATSQAGEVVNLQILNVVVPQLRLLAHVSGILGLLTQVSSNESAAATAIAISHQPQAVLRTERQLDATVQSLARTATDSLLSTQRLLYALVPANATAAATTFGSAKSAAATAVSQLHLANSDLRQLVSQLVGN